MSMNDEALILAQSTIGMVRLLVLQDLPGARDIIEATGDILSKIDGVTPVHSRYYRMSSQYFKVGINSANTFHVLTFSHSSYVFFSSWVCMRSTIKRHFDFSVAPIYLNSPNRRSRIGLSPWVSRLFWVGTYTILVNWYDKLPNFFLSSWSFPYVRTFICFILFAHLPR